jgi:hypothetical protein
MIGTAFKLSVALRHPANPLRRQECPLPLARPKFPSQRSLPGPVNRLTIQ